MRTRCAWLIAAVTMFALVMTGVARASTWATTVQASSSGQAQTQSVPGAPSSVALTCLSSSLKQAKLTWNAVSRATSYSIYRSATSSSIGFTLTASGVATTTWTSSSLSSGRYWFRVAAVIGTNWQGSTTTASGSVVISSSTPNCTLGG